MAVSREGHRGRQHWRNRIEGTEKQVAAGLRHGFRSGLEKENADRLERLGVPFAFENLKVKYVIPETVHTYSPDFLLLPNGILVETKGLFETKDRQKHVLIKAQWPTMDLRFVFQRPTDRISKTSRTTYGQWATANDFKWATKFIPEEWTKEPMVPDLPDFIKEMLDQHHNGA